MSFQRIMRIAWVLWLAVVAVFSWPALQEHFDIFSRIDPRFYRLILVLLPLGVAAGWLYTAVRHRGLWRHEPWLVALLPLLLGAIYAPLATVVLLGVTAIAAAAGKSVLRRGGLETDLSLAALTGFGLLSSILFVLGILRLFRLEAFVVLLLVATLLSRRSFPAVRDELVRVVSAWRQGEELKQSCVGVAVFAALILTVMAALAWLTPTSSGDPVRMHLSLVRVFLAQHSLDVPAVIPYGYFPQGFEVLAAMAYALGGQFAAQGMELVFFALLLRLVFSVARACGATRGWAIVGVTLGMAIPFLHWAGTAFKNDAALAAYEVGALLCFLRWRESSKFGWIVLGTFLIAMSFGVKHVVLFAAIPLFCLYAYAVWRQPRRILAGATLAGMFLCFGLLWHVRTYLATGNPVYPESLRTAVKPAHSKSRWNNGIWRYVAIPYNIHHNAKKYFESGSPNPAGIVILILAPLWLMRAPLPRNRRTEAVVWFFLLLYYLYWGGTWIVLRYAIAPFLLLAALGAARLDLQPRWAAMTAVTMAVVFSLPVIVIMEMTPAQPPYLLKSIDKSEYLRRTLPPYGAVDFLSHHANADDAIASVGNWAAGYSPNPAKFDHIYRTDRRYTAADVNTVLSGERNYLILPNHQNLSDLERAAGERYKLTRLYTDLEFIVYGLAR